VRRVSLVLTVAFATLVASAVPAGAQAPPGDWTLVRQDGYRHYACKVKAKDDWRIKTATRYNNKRLESDIGVYAAVARGSNRNVVAQRSSNDRENGYIRTLLRGAQLSDRLWMQAAAYGPAEPWSDGFAVRKLVRCASVA
jgi:hypothetical protein